MSQTQRRDEFDQYVDDLLASPDRAEELKRKLRRTFGDQATPAKRRAQIRLLTICSDAEALWDNVPL